MTTFTTLKADIENYTQNNDAVFLAQLPSIIRLAEKRIYNDAKLPHIRKNAVGALTIGSRAYTLPTDFISMQSFTITVPVTGEVTHLIPKAPDFISELYPVPATQAQPKYYGQNSGTALVVGPTPGVAYVTGVNYFGYPVSIVDAVGGTSWLGDNFGQLLLHSCLVEAYVFMKGTKELLDYYISLTKIGLDELKEAVKSTDVSNYR